MKKITSGTLALLMVVSQVVFGFNQTFAMTEAGLCWTLNDEAYGYANGVVSVLATKGYKIDNLVGPNTSKREQAMQLRLELIDELETILGGVGVCDEVQALTKEDILTHVRSYVMALTKLIAQSGYTAPVQLHHYKEAEDAMLQLQNHAMELLMSLSSASTQFGQKEDYNLGFLFSDNGVGFNGSLILKTDSNTDMTNNLAQTRIFADGHASFDGDEYTTAVTATGTIDVELRIIKDQLYVALHDLALTATPGNDAIDEFIATIPTIKEVWGDNFLTDLDGTFGAQQALGFAEYTTLTHAFSTVPALQFIHQEGNTYYGSLNPKFCEQLLEDMKQSCLEAADQMLLESDNKGEIFLTINGGTYTLGLTDKFMTDKPAEQFMNNVALFTWNTQGITQLYIPLDENPANKVLWKNGLLNVVYGDETGALTLGGDLRQGMINLVGTLRTNNAMINDIAADFSFSMIDAGNNSNNVKLTVHVDAGEGNVLDISLKGTEQLIPFRAFGVPSKLMSIDEFSTMLEEVLWDEPLE